MLGQKKQEDFLGCGSRGLGGACGPLRGLARRPCCLGIFPLARLVGTFLIHTKLVLPVRAVETASAAVLRRSGLAAVKMVCARSCLHELFKGPVAAGSKVYRRSPPFCFWAQKSGVLISPKGKRERRRLRCRI